MNLFLNIFIALSWILMLALLLTLCRQSQEIRTIIIEQTHHKEEYPKKVIVNPAIVPVAAYRARVV